MNRANRRRENREGRKPTESTETTETAMGNVSHTHPYADHGAVNRPFQRGPIVAADGGEREAYDEDTAEEEADAREEEADEEHDSDERMRDIDHTPPHGEGANRVFERGGKEEPVESEE